MTVVMNHLDNLKSRMEKKESELSKLKLAIEAEEKRVKEKTKKDNEKWWKDVSRQMEKCLIDLYGSDYKETIKQTDLVGAVEVWASERQYSDETEGEDLYESD